MVVHQIKKLLIIPLYSFYTDVSTFVMRLVEFATKKCFAFFFTGMLEPRPSDGGVLGPTFQCIVAEQFRRLRVGDRFWHENARNPSLHTDQTAYNGSMLQEIRKTTFAKILCDNADSITAVNKMVFQQSKGRVNCDQLPTVSLNPWITPHRDLG